MSIGMKVVLIVGKYRNNPMIRIPDGTFCELKLNVEIEKLLFDENNDLLFGLGRESLSLWKYHPLLAITTVRRSEEEVKNTGHFSDMVSNQDFSIVCVSTSKSWILLYKLNKSSPTILFEQISLFTTSSPVQLIHSHSQHLFIFTQNYSFELIQWPEKAFLDRKIISFQHQLRQCLADSHLAEDQLNNFEKACIIEYNNIFILSECGILFVIQFFSNIIKSISDSNFIIKKLHYTGITSIISNKKYQTLLVCRKNGKISEMKLNKGEWAEKIEFSIADESPIFDYPDIDIKWNPSYDTILVYNRTNFWIFSKFGNLICNVDFTNNFLKLNLTNVKNINLSSIIWAGEFSQIFTIKSQHSNYFYKINILKNSKQPNGLIIFHDSNLIYFSSLDIKKLNFIPMKNTQKDMTCTNFFKSSDNWSKIHFQNTNRYFDEKIISVSYGFQNSLLAVQSQYSIHILNFRTQKWMNAFDIENVIPRMIWFQNFLIFFIIKKNSDCNFIYLSMFDFSKKLMRTIDNIKFLNNQQKLSFTIWKEYMFILFDRLLQVFQLTTTSETLKFEYILGISLDIPDYKFLNKIEVIQVENNCDNITFILFILIDDNFFYCYIDFTNIKNKSKFLVPNQKMKFPMKYFSKNIENFWLSENISENPSQSVVISSKTKIFVGIPFQKFSNDKTAMFQNTEYTFLEYPYQKILISIDFNKMIFYNLQINLFDSKFEHPSLKYCFQTKLIPYLIYNNIFIELIEKDQIKILDSVLSKTNDFNFSCIILDLTLHDLVEKSHSKYINSNIDETLSKFIKYLSNTKFYLKTICYFLRKSEISRWHLILNQTECVMKLFDKCCQQDDIELASSYLNIILCSHPPNLTVSLALSLLKRAIFKKNWGLARDIDRYTRSIIINVLMTSDDGNKTCNKLACHDHQNDLDVSQNINNNSLIEEFKYSLENVVICFINDYQFKDLGNLLFYMKFDFNTFLQSNKARLEILEPDPHKMFDSLSLDFNLVHSTTMNKITPNMNSNFHKKSELNRIVQHDQLNNIRKYFYDHHYFDIWILLSFFQFDLKSIEEIIVKTSHFFEEKLNLVEKIFHYYQKLSDSFFSRIHFEAFKQLCKVCLNNLNVSHDFNEKTEFELENISSYLQKYFSENS